MSAMQNVNKVIRQVIPRGHRFKISLEPTGLGKYKVLRIVTPAWKSLPRFERILKVQKGIDSLLPQRQTDDILPVSVLTADEYRRLRRNVAPRTPRKSPQRIKWQAMKAR